MLDPQARALIDLMIEKRVPPVHTLTPAEARRLYRERRAFTQPEPPVLPEVRELTMAGPGGALPMRLYRPGPADAGGGAWPLLVYFHGGGWTIGDVDTHDVLCRQLALAGACAVLSVDYRLAPEHRFPAALDDCLAATRWARAEAGALGIDARRIAVGGDSAGGNLAAVVALAERDAGPGAGAPLAAQLLIYPATDMRALAPSHQANAQGYLLTADSIAYYRGHYTPEVASWTDWRVSPLLAGKLAGLPPALVLTAGFDPLRDEGRQYADALSAAGNRVQYVCFERQVHGFITMSRVIDEALSAVALSGAVLRRLLRGE
ncbi:MAG: alpha/beta hydrolase fold domain-containing protein [Burkholderiales bacterium]|nr:alpha/beta hydrolase fold domain-containing protein [Burkholderiales bacterium]